MMSESRNRRRRRYLVAGLAIAVAGAIVLLLYVAPWSASRPATHVPVGTILDLSGPAASFGEMQLQGMRLALEDIATSSCPYKIDLIVEDSRLDPKLALAAAGKLFDSDKVVALSSITGSSMALTVAPAAKRAHVPIVDSLSSSPALSHDGGDFYFRVQPPDTYAGVYLVRWARELGMRTSAVVYADSDWGQGLRDAIVDAAGKEGLTVILREPAKPGDVDFRALLARVNAAHPEVVYLVAHPQEAGLFIKQAAEAGLRMRIMGSDSLSTEEVRTAAGRAVDGVMFALSAAGSGSAAERFQSRFQSRYGTQASANSIKPYDALMLLHHVVCTTGPSPAAIRSGLRQLKGYKGISGVISFDEHGDPVMPEYDRFVYKGTSYARM